MTREFKNAVEKIGEYVSKFSGNKLSLKDKSGSAAFLASAMVKYANINTEVAVIQPKGQSAPDVIFSSAAVKLPKENLVAFFRQLLVWNNLATDVAHYSLNEKLNTVFLVLRRPFEGLDYSEFKNALEKISAVNMNCIIRLKQSFRW